MIEKRPFQELETPRLFLKKHKTTLSYAHAVYELIEKNKEALFRWIEPMRKIQKAEDEHHYFLNSRRDWKQMKTADFAIYEKVSGHLIGAISFIKIDYKNRAGEIGYWLDKDAAGRGYMTEAVKALEDHFFGIGFHRIQILMDGENERSENVARRGGYHLDGIIRNDGYDTFFKNPHRDTKVYSRLHQEWEKQR